MVYSSIDPVFAIPGILVGAGFLILAFWVVCFLSRAGTNRESYDYRKYLADLYIAGKIRQLADTDKIDLVAEEYLFWRTEAKMNSKKARDLDEKIEINLMDRVSDTYDKETKKKKGE